MVLTLKICRTNCNGILQYDSLNDFFAMNYYQNYQNNNILLLVVKNNGKIYKANCTFIRKKVLSL